MTVFCRISGRLWYWAWPSRHFPLLLQDVGMLVRDFLSGSRAGYGLSCEQDENKGLRQLSPWLSCWQRPELLASLVCILSGLTISSACMNRIALAKKSFMHCGGLVFTSMKKRKSHYRPCMAVSRQVSSLRLVTGWPLLGNTGCSL